MHLVCEAIRKDFESVNEYISTFKALLSKSPSRIELFKKTTNLALPPSPVLTRWGTFLEAANYHFEIMIKCYFLLQN